MITNQTQKSGDDSTNIQAQNMTLNIGIDEKRAREIYQEMNLQLKKEYTQEALELANKRVSEFENKLMPKMEEIDGALESFADPSFQLLLVDAQKTAASTERPADYDLLSELLIHRFQKGENRFTRAGISRAVEIVDEVSDDALLGLTAIHSITRFSPSAGNIEQGLDTLDTLFGKMFNQILPSGDEWLDHLDILDAVRLNSLGSMKNIQEIYTLKLSGYVDVGIEKNSVNHKKAIEILENNNLSKEMLVDHLLNSNFVRLNVPNRSEIKFLKFAHLSVQDKSLVPMIKLILPEQVSAVDSIYGLYNQDNNLKQQNTDLFMKEWDKRINLKILREWWDKLNVSIQITSVGKVLAHSNAQRCDKSLPSFN